MGAQHALHADRAHQQAAEAALAAGGSGRTGARWQTATVHRLEKRPGLDRPAALREMTRRCDEHARTGAPVHDWPVP